MTMRGHRTSYIELVLNVIEENTSYTLTKFDENCQKRKPSNSQVHVHAVITFQFEKTIP